VKIHFSLIYIKETFSLIQANDSRLIMVQDQDDTKKILGILL